MWFIARRLAFSALAAWVAITANFAIPRVMPGNAVDALLAKFPNLDANSLHALQAEFGTHSHGSLLSQYVSYLGNLAHGNLGLSINEYPAKVTTVIAQTLPWTVILVGTATIISFAVGTLLGIVSAWRRGGWLDRSLPAFAFLQATPYFFLALVAIQLFAVSWGLFPFGIDWPSTGATSCCPLAAPHPAGRGWSHEGPQTGKRQRPSPGGGRGRHDQPAVEADTTNRPRQDKDDQ